MSKAIAQKFAVSGEVAVCERYGNGHINETYIVVTDTGAVYILQKINNGVFKDVVGLMHNISSVTKFLAEQDSDPRHAMHLVNTIDGATYLHDEATGYWRMYDFVLGSLCLQAAETSDDFYQSAVAFGDFQRCLAAFPAQTLTETIPHFHDTPDRFRQLHEAIEKDVMGRKAEVEKEIEFALAREEEAGELMRLLKAGELPLRVTHNDTKLNNVLLDKDTRKPLCIIDLDTVMPGLAAFDVGDSIRFGAATAAEDEKDLSKVECSMELFECYIKGFMEGCCGSLTEKEKETLPLGAKTMTLECGIRFLADYLNGDTYFRIHRPEHNLDRCRTQFKLVADMEEKWETMQEIVRKA